MCFIIDREVEVFVYRVVSNRQSIESFVYPKAKWDNPVRGGY